MSVGFLLLILTESLADEFALHRQGRLQLSLLAHSVRKLVSELDAETPLLKWIARLSQKPESGGWLILAGGGGRHLWQLKHFQVREVVHFLVNVCVVLKSLLGYVWSSAQWLLKGRNKRNRSLRRFLQPRYHIVRAFIEQDCGVGARLLLGELSFVVD